MKQINYTGSSKIISRIVYLLNRKAPLPLDGDGDPDWGTNGQVLSTDGAGNTAWVNAGGGGSGGHTIWNRIKSALTQRGKLWFADASVSDVSADDATKVEVVTELLNETAFDNLATDGTADGIYTFPDSGGVYLTASMSTYDNTLSGLSATDVQDAIDELAQSGGGINYSTTEQVIGTWITGKPLYQKTIVAPTEMEISQSSWTATGLYIQDGGYVIECHGINKDGGYQGSVLAYIASSDGELFLVTPRNSIGYVQTITIRYTKTTD